MTRVPDTKQALQLALDALKAALPLLPGRLDPELLKIRDDVRAAITQVRSALQQQETRGAEASRGSLPPNGSPDSCVERGSEVKRQKPDFHVERTTP